ncbi:phosphotransferase family protein [Ferrimonas marina]|nr:phosphotransferase [Ferrimonas marina]
MAGASSNRLYRIACDGDDYVLRLHQADNAFAVSRADEHRAWQLAAEAGAAPTLLHWSDNPPFSLARYGGESVTQPALPALLDLLERLHRLPVKAKPLPYADLIECYLSGQQTTELDSFLRLLPVWLSSLNGSGVSPGWCHHDLHEGNLLSPEPGRLWAVDFEYAGFGHPYLDLVAVSVNWPAGRQRTLLYAYCQARGLQANAPELKAWQGAQGIYWLLCAAWATRMPGPQARRWRVEALSQLERLNGR